MNSNEKICGYCGETIKSIARVCKHCKSDISDQVEMRFNKIEAVEVPKTIVQSHTPVIKVKSIFNWKKISLYLIITITAISYGYYNNSKKGLTFFGNKIQNSSQQTVQAMDQSEFINLIKNYCQRYDKANNQADATNIRKYRKEDLSRLSGIVKNWNVILSQVTTNKNGEALIAFDVSYRSEVNCGGTIFFGDGITFWSVISPQHPSYRALTSFRIGSQLLLSGSLPSSSSNYHYFAEDSTTEEGAMRSPDFVFKTSSISNVQSNSSQGKKPQTNSPYQTEKKVYDELFELK